MNDVLHSSIILLKRMSRVLLNDWHHTAQISYISCLVLDAIAAIGGAYGAGSGPVFISQLTCSGSESSVLNCPVLQTYGLVPCDHSRDVGVRCVGKMASGTCKLSDLSVHFPVDINECLTNNGGCAQNCTNTVGSYFCSCSTGYVLGSDGHMCNGKE